MSLIASLADVTDLSLEQTQMGDSGNRYLESLKKLEWLNLYGTQVTDAGMKVLQGFNNLQHLPIGRTKVTDVGIGGVGQNVATQLSWTSWR